MEHQANQKPKFIPNTFIQQNLLYGELKDENIAKKYLTQDIIRSYYPDEKGNIQGLIIPKEDELGLQKTVFGGMIITTESIGTRYCHSYNNAQQKHIKNKTYAHKSLCERRDEPMGLLFMSIYDFLGNVKDYTSLDNKLLCLSVQSNIQAIIEEKLPWVINYSKHVIRDYYSMSSNKLKFKLNFILDDGKYEESENIENEKTKGGLLLNGFLNELEYYTRELEAPMRENIGIICQILAPNGLPCNKKWLQIDVGISFMGKRLFNESLNDACIRRAKTIRAHVHPDIIKTANINNKLYYGSFPDGHGYEGYTIFIWEILYSDQLIMEDENHLDKAFCKCLERYESIDEARLNRHIKN